MLDVVGEPDMGAPVDAPGDTAQDIIAEEAAPVCHAVPYEFGYYACLPLIPNADGQVPLPRPGGYVCDPTSCPAACEPCPTWPYSDPGVSCLPDPAVDANANCPSYRVCNPDDCPPGCIDCVNFYFCIPNQMAGCFDADVLSR